MLRDFVKWAVTEHPAQHYMLVIWNHGAGWDDSNLYEGDYFSGATPPVVQEGQGDLTRTGARSGSSR